MMIAPDRLEELFDRADRVLARLENLLPGTQPPPDWNAAVAFRWRKRGTQGWLQPVAKPHPIRLADIETVDEQKARIVANTRQFVAGHGANNVLLVDGHAGRCARQKAKLRPWPCTIASWIHTMASGSR